MAIVKAVSSKASVGKAIKYVTNESKTEMKLITGINCSPETAIEEMVTTKAMWHKTEGRQYKHYVHSFPKEEKISPEKAHELANKLCENRFPGHEVIIATHTDREHIHSHIIVNSVNMETGKKIRESKHDLQAMKDTNDLICKENGLSVCEKSEVSLNAYNMKKYKALERWSENHEPSIVGDCYKAVKKAKEVATDKNNFKDLMKHQGYDMVWQQNRKHITFIDLKRKEKGEAKYKIRNQNLEKTFDEPMGKEDLERGFERNRERTEAEQGRGNGNPTDTEESRDIDAEIRELETTIGDTENAITDEETRRETERSEEIRGREQEERAREEAERTREETIRARASKGYEIGD